MQADGYLFVPLKNKVHQSENKRTRSEGETCYYLFVLHRLTMLDRDGCYSNKDRFLILFIYFFSPPAIPETMEAIPDGLLPLSPSAVIFDWLLIRCFSSVFSDSSWSMSACRASMVSSNSLWRGTPWQSCRPARTASLLGVISRVEP